MILIDQEFENLIPPLSHDEFSQLEENCIRDGIRDPLIVWPQGDGNDILIDGHNRFKICTSHGGIITFDIKRMNFRDRDEAKAWIITNQFGRRNLSAYDRSVLALKLKPIIAKKAKETQGTRNDICQKSDKSTDTKKELASIAGVSHDTIHKVEAIENKATDRTKELIREGKLSINQAYNSVRPKRSDPVKEAKREHEEFQDRKKSEIVSIKDAQIDKINKNIIDTQLYEDVLNLLNRINAFQITYCQYSLDHINNVIDDDERKNLIDQCDKCQLTLTKIKQSIRR